MNALKKMVAKWQDKHEISLSTLQRVLGGKSVSYQKAYNAALAMGMSEKVATKAAVEYVKKHKEK